MKVVLSFICLPICTGVNLQAHKDERKVKLADPLTALVLLTAFIMFVLKDSEVFIVLDIALRGADSAASKELIISVEM